jgi:glycerol kinase
MTICDPVILAIDQGTTSSRAMLFSKSGRVLGTRQKDLKLYTPNNGWVEQNPEDIWNDTLWCIQSLFSDFPSESKRIVSIGITNQRETTILWNRKTGKAVYNAIVWQDRRASDLCVSLKDQGYEEDITNRTGLLLDPYFSATKISWVLKNVEGAMDLAKSGDLAFGTVETFLLWRLTGGRIHATDATNASRTMLYNIAENIWDEKLLSLFDIPKSLLPEVRDNICHFGVTDKSILGVEISVGAMAGDQQAALFGQACFERGMVKSTYGTGCFALMNIGSEFRVSKNRLLTTIAYRINGKTCYALEGAIFVAGAAIQWLRDELHLFAKSSDTNIMAQSVRDTDGVYFVPAFTGLGAPYWCPDARGMICGISRGTTSAHIVRAALEAQVYQTRDLMQAFSNDSGQDVKVMRIDGGLSANDFMCQFLSDQLCMPVELPEMTETTALGVSYMAGIQAGIYRDLDDVASHWILSKSYHTDTNLSQSDRLYDGWKSAIKKVVS